MSLAEKMIDIEIRLLEVENRFNELGYDTKQIVTSEFKNTFAVRKQREAMFALHTALVVDTIDPWKQNRIRFYSPFLHKPDVPIKALPFAHAISPMGGFDDCGMSWIPPAGSTICILFENGSRSTPFYIGTTWHRDRGSDGQHNWSYPVEEYYEIHEGHRNGYIVGPNDGSQVFPPWNTENYNGFDIDSINDFENDPEAQQRITYPNIYGWKTPQKHYTKYVDGDYKCSHRWKRIETMSSTGNWFMMKDDHIRPAGQWAHPQCACGGGDVSDCPEEEKSGPSCIENVDDKPTCANPYFKQESECRPYKGPQTPQNNKCELPQSGIQFVSVGGHSFLMDDSVEQPTGEPNWERNLRGFDFGCTDKCEGKTAWISMTGHRFEMNDFEDQPKQRGQENYIRIITASGNSLEANDHTISKCDSDPIAGEKRGWTMTSTSNHLFAMIDEGNEQGSPCRKEGGIPVNKAKNGYIMARSGYGLTFLMHDAFSQQETQQQKIVLFCPQKDNDERGPHINIFQESPDGPGFVLLRVGGNYITTTYDHHLQIVGDPDNPANKLRLVTDNTLNLTENFYLNLAKTHFFLADEYIVLAAGKELPPRCPSGGDCGPCIWPVLCLSPKGITISDRVFASASPNAECASMFQLKPFTDCPEMEGC